MNSAIDQPRRAELHLDAISQLVTPFYDDVRADPQLGPTFETVLSSRSFSGNAFAKHMTVPGVTARHFERWLQLWALQTQTLFDGPQARRLQKVASDIARNLYRGYFGNAAGFDVIVLEMRHGGR